MSSEENKMDEIRKRVKAKMDFFRHLITYLAVMVILAIVNNVTGSSYQWWLWPALGWGIGIVAHFLGTFVTGESIEKKLIEKEIEKDREE